MTKVSRTMLGKPAAMFDAGCLCWSACTAKMGWLICQGQAVSRTIYATLFAAIGAAATMGEAEVGVGALQAALAQIAGGV